MNFESYKLLCFARMTGFLWWLLGAWVIGKWSYGLWGATARYLVLILWCICPNVVAFEQRVTPDLPLAVIWVAASYSLWRHLRAPSWDRALACGLVLGVSQLVDFASLALILVWALVALLHRSARPSQASAGITPSTRMLQVVSAIGLSVWCTNVGYGFIGSGAAPGSFDFVSSTLNGSSRHHLEAVDTQATGNRFRGTWLGRVATPVPADYFKGLDRRLAEWHSPPRPLGSKKWPVEAERNPLVIAGERQPIGIWGMVLGGMSLFVARRRGRAGVPEVLTLGLPVVAVLLLTIPAVGLLSVASGFLLTTPFAIIIASSLAVPWTSGDRGKSAARAIAWATAVLSLWAIGDSIGAICVHQITAENRARFRRDLDKYWRRLRLPRLPRRFATGTEGAHGLRYSTFVDARGVAMNYALYVPRGYSGNRQYPLVLFLHGYGDRGTEGLQFTAVGLPFKLEYRDIDFLVLCPQGASGTWETGGEEARLAMELLASVQKTYRVDPKQVFLTGVSSGGTGVWDLAAEYRSCWAAIVPVASAPGDLGKSGLIKDIPCWCFHNHYDGDIPAADVRTMIEGMRAAGGSPKYTEYMNVNHNVWDRAYGSTELFNWLSRQRRP